jgi:hypothetical protein
MIGASRAPVRALLEIHDRAAESATHAFRKSTRDRTSASTQVTASHQKQQPAITARRGCYLARRSSQLKVRPDFRFDQIACKEAASVGRSQTAAPGRKHLRSEFAGRRRLSKQARPAAYAGAPRGSASPERGRLLLRVTRRSSQAPQILALLVLVPSERASRLEPRCRNPWLSGTLGVAGELSSPVAHKQRSARGQPRLLLSPVSPLAGLRAHRRPSKRTRRLDRDCGSPWRCRRLSAADRRASQIPQLQASEPRCCLWRGARRTERDGASPALASALVPPSARNRRLRFVRPRPTGGLVGRSAPASRRSSKVVTTGTDRNLAAETA